MDSAPLRGAEAPLFHGCAAAVVWLRLCGCAEAPLSPRLHPAELQLRSSISAESKASAGRIIRRNRHWNPFINGHELALARSGVDLARAGDLLLGIGDEFLPLR